MEGLLQWSRNAWEGNDHLLLHRLSVPGAPGLSPRRRPPSDYSRENIAKIAPQVTLQLRSANVSDRQNALEIIHKVGQTSSRILSDNLPLWTDALIENENYDDVLNLTMIAITDRSFDTTTVEKLQEARVRALIGQQKLDQALIEAKSFYNICILSSTPYAIDLLSNILERQGRSPVASRLRFEQTRTPTTQPTSPLAPVPGGEGQGEGSNFENGLPLGGTVLTSIKIDPLIWQDALDHAGGHSLNNAMSRGNIDLLMDKPDEARKEFQLAVELSDGSSSSKNMREAVEGIARSIRVKEGSAEPANAFILFIRQEPSKALSVKVESEKLKEVARQVTLAPVRALAVPALEEERAKREVDSVSHDYRIDFTTGFETSSPLRFQRLSATRYKVVLTPPSRTFCDWFCFRVDEAKGQAVRVDLTTEFAPLDRWWTLHPLWCEAADYDHPDLPGRNEASGTEDDGKGIPDTSTQSWHYIPDAWRSDPRTFSFVQTFTSDHVFVAMRVPYVPSQNVRFLRDMTSSNKSLDLVEIGTSRQKRPLLMAKVGTGNPKSKPCVPLYAGEHADESDGMWAARGAIEFLASDEPQAKLLRERCTFFVIPQLDPDGSAKAIHEGINTTFLTEIQTQESIAYANWFQSWINAGNRLDLVLDLHNMQSSEMGHAQCWLMEGVGERGELSSLVHRSIFSGISAADFEMIGTPMQRGWSPDRLGGWLDRRFGPLCFLYELNSQAPRRHLTLAGLKAIGATIAKVAGGFFDSADASKLLANVDARRKERQARWVSSGEAPKGMNAIQSEAIASSGVGIVGESSSSATVEKWVP